MFFRRKVLLSLLSLAIIIVPISYLNKSNKTKINFFIWQTNEISIGNLIGISLILGTTFSTTLNILLINQTNISQKDRDYNANEKTFNDVENHSSQNKPPERDIRDAQPTVSVNYRVVKDSNINEFNYDETEKNDFYSDEDEDWNTSENEW